MPARILQGDVLSVLQTLPADSYDCAVTSPPYWMLRSYLPNGHVDKGHELGSEPTPDAYVANMVRVFREVRRVLVPWGVCWCNIGDCYSGGGPHHGENNLGKTATNPGSAGGMDRFPAGLAPGNLVLIPQRLALALQADGWTVRSVVVWHKPAPMPASLSGWRWQRCRVKVKAQKQASEAGLYASGSGNRTARPGSGGVTGKMPPEYQTEWVDCPGCDRCRPHGGCVLRRGSWRCTSSWEPLLMLAKTSRYYGDGEAVKTPVTPATVNRRNYSFVYDDGGQYAAQHDHENWGDSGANLRDVWTIAAEPLREKHYAAFPTELVYRCLASSTSQRGYCPECGAPWARVVETEFCLREGRVNTIAGCRDGGPKERGWDGMPTGTTESRTIGWRPSCSCPGDLPPRPARVLDPFAGSGRVGVQALRMGLDFTGVELSPAYCEMARRILAEESPLFGGVE